jgi:predicted transcriptional regulator
MAKSVGLNKGTGGRKRNLTIQLDEEIIQQAKELAVRRNTSVSGLVTQKLEEMVEDEIRYRKAMASALEAMHNAEDLGGGKWSREELHEERLKRFDK